MHWSTNYSNLKLHRNSRGRYIISFYIDGRRFRFSHGKCLGCTIKPNSLSGEAKDRASIELLSRFKAALDEGWTPLSIEQNKTCYESLMEFTPSPSLSLGYQKELAKTANQFSGFLKAQELTSLPHSALNKRIVHDYLTTSSTTPSSFNHERARLSSILGHIMDEQDLPNPCARIATKKTKQSLHKPFEDVSAVLEDIRSFNENLFLCCLLTYGCLLRPHREIRQLTWGDFSDDLTFISLSGDRNKSGRNRIVPVTSSVRAYLTPKERHLNVFSDSPTPFNQDYFKTLWGRYKAQSELIQPEQTLYSFRHTGAIDVFKRSESLELLRRALGHTSVLATTNYLRGLPLLTLNEEEMPHFPELRGTKLK